MTPIQDYQINEFTRDFSLRDKAFFAFIRQSGLNPNTIRKLKISNLEGNILENNVIAPCKIDVPKELEKYHIGAHPSFIAEETINHLYRYLQNRKVRYKENLSQNSFLFIVENKPSRQISIKEINRKLKKSSRNVLTLNELREFFKQIAKPIGTNHLNYIMGNKTKDYIPEKDEFYRQQYREIIDSLQIEPIPNSKILKMEKENKDFEHKLKLIEEALGQFLKKPEEPKEGEIIVTPILDPIAEERKIDEELQAYEEYKEIQQRKDYDDEMRRDYEESNDYQMGLEHQEEELYREAEERGITIGELNEELDFAKFAYEYEQRKEENAKMKKLQEAYREITRKTKNTQPTT
jgi:hypothetical protein